MIKKTGKPAEKYKLCKYCHYGYVVQVLGSSENTGCSLLRDRSKCKKLKYSICVEKERD